MQGKHKLILLGIITLAVVLRLVAALWLGDTLAGEQQYRVADQRSYNALAQSLLAGHGYAFDRPWYPFGMPAYTPTAHWSFIYPLFMAGIYTVTGYHPLAARLVQAVIVGILTTWVIYRLGRRLFGSTVGLAAAALSAVYAYFIFHDAALMTEPFFIVCVIASLEIALGLGGVVKKDETASQAKENAEGVQAVTEKGWWGKWALLGLLLGLAAVLRQTILLWAPIMCVWLGFRTFKRSGRQAAWGMALSVGVIVTMILPWTVRNYMVFGSFLPLNSNAGYALYSANHPNHGTQFDQDYAAPLPEDLKTLGLNEAQWNSELTKHGIQFILEDPRRYLLLSLDRVGIFFNFWFSSESSLASNLMRVLSFGVYLPFFIAGLWLSRRDWRRCMLVYLFVVAFSALHILTWASIRYRLPVDAALMPFAALAIVSLYKFTTARVSFTGQVQK